MSSLEIEFWSGAGGQRWLASEKFTARSVGAFDPAVMEAAAPRAGERVVDIGCGTGGTTIALARAVGPEGRVVGVDVSPPLLEVARSRAAGLANVSLVEADAQTHDLGRQRFDLVFSRFGVMFFGDPVEAFRRLRDAATPNGRLAFVCWRSLKENPWGFVPFMAAVPHLPPMERPAPETPGPFAFGDPERVRRILDGAGWREARIDPVERPIELSGDGGLEEAVQFATTVGAASRALALAPEPDRARAVAAIRSAFESHLTADGRVALGGACWVVTARA